ncbi:hypothetical protein ABFS82_03G049000 [Erythranthe guttata]|uniref:Serpin domain-containing protein n=1 Tax=Erythranthe guttata TaxID=4155 RepID=A0A022QCK1_ERYGU|nr:PREDICTED: serpin-ZX-like [Erythranthe guttata]EYU25364.1 hypothetical protein MIMGU_mgv1a007690mg [Erythranthe guttata]|eukprot:XP_012851722.1 PREDICTED: serpin-ZX-like [Erythranthe guttata]
MDRRRHREPIPNLTDASLSLAKHVITAHAGDANVVISPLSIQVSLGMIAAGSNGPTRDQLLGFLKSKSIEELNSLSSRLVTHVFAEGRNPLIGGPRFSLASGVWIDHSLTFKPSYEGIITQNAYMAAANRVDFRTKAVEVTKEVNAWAEEKTNGLIKEILSPGSINADTALIFANAVYFKGDWVDEFKEYMNRDCKFFLNNGTSVQVPFMTSYEKQYVRAFDGFKVLRRPYRQGRDRKRSFSMYFFLPDAKDGLPDLLDRVASESGFIESHTPNRPVLVGEFRIPKFKINFQFEAMNVIKELGVVLPFYPGGLTEMVDSAIDGESLYVSGIFQKAFIEVNEKGTEAAAVSNILVGGGGDFGRKKRLDFVADHPFLFAIREDKTGVVVFFGQLINPIAY